jgi:glycosyltransferase involved in cell wall biosynthesis
MIPASRSSARVAYVLKGFPVLSETFISSEIHRVERAGLELDIFVMKPRNDREHHPVVDRIRAQPHYLPPTTPIVKGRQLQWLAANLPRFLPAFVRVARRRPRGTARAAMAAVGRSLRGRPTLWAPPKVSYIRDLLVALALSRELLERPAVRHLHAHFAHDSTTVTWLASVITGLPFSFTAHAKDIYSERLNPGDLLARKLAAASFAVTCSEINRKHVVELAQGTPVHRIHHGLNDDFSKYLEDGRAPLPSGEGLRLLTVGRLVAKKGLDVFVEACGVLLDRGIELEAAIVGDEDTVGDPFSVRTDLEERIARLGLSERVRLTGQLGQADVFELYLRSDVFCLPCRILDNGDRDGIPNVLVEAMACRIPVVSTTVSGIPELVQDGVNGLLVPPEDPDALADAVARLHKDPALAGELAHAGQVTVKERFDGDRLVAELARLFREIIA